MAVTMNFRWDDAGTVIPAGQAKYTVNEQPIAEYDNWALYTLADDIQAVIDDVISKFNANTILKADTDNTPVALTIGTNTIVGRAAGNISALTASETRTLLNVENGATADQTNTEIRNAVQDAVNSNTFTDADHSKLDGIEALADVTDATNVNAAGAVMESDIKEQSFTNLLENGSLEAFTNGTGAPPDGWMVSGTGTYSRSTIHKIGTYSWQLNSATNSIHAYQNVADYERYRSRTVTFGCWVRAGHSHTRLYIEDNNTGLTSYSHSGSNDWEWLTVTYTPGSGATRLQVRLQVDAGSYIVYFDSAMLVEGTLCPPFSPKPMPNPSLITAAPQDTGYNGEMRIYSSGGTRRLYISDGSNWETISDPTNNEIRDAVEAATDSNTFTNADHSKLNGIESGATTDQTNTEIRDAVEAATDSNTFTDADHTKLNGISTTRVVVVKAIADDDGLYVANGITHFTVPIELNGMNLVSVGAHIYTKSSSGDPLFQIHNLTDSVDMLSSRLRIDASDDDTKDASNPPVIDTAHDDVVTGDVLRFDCDVAGTGTAGMEIRMGFE